MPVIVGTFAYAPKVAQADQLISSHPATPFPPLSVNDDLSAKVLARLKEVGVAVVAMRCAGYNNVDVEAGAGVPARGKG